jgi:hypothetical protein
VLVAGGPRDLMCCPRREKDDHEDSLFKLGPSTAPRPRLVDLRCPPATTVVGVGESECGGVAGVMGVRTEYQEGLAAAPVVTPAAR